jgi:hypothetical protein
VKQWPTLPSQIYYMSDWGITTCSHHINLFEWMTQLKWCIGSYVFRIFLLWYSCCSKHQISGVRWKHIPFNRWFIFSGWQFSFTVEGKIRTAFKQTYIYLQPKKVIVLCKPHAMHLIALLFGCTVH